MNRRRALGVFSVVLGAIVVASLGIGRRLTARYRSVTHRAGPPDPSPVDPALLQRLAVFAGALFGHRLDDRDVRSVSEGISLLVQRDGGWRPELIEGAEYVDRLARAQGSASFAESTDEVRERIVDRIMRPPVATWGSSLLATISRDERVRRRLRTEMIDRLARVYRTSPASWRRRGYARTPGEPGDPREYTHPGTAPAC